MPGRDRAPDLGQKIRVFFDFACSDRKNHVTSVEKPVKWARVSHYY